MPAPKKPAPVVVPQAIDTDAVSSDTANWEVKPSSLEFPADQGVQVEQVHVGITEAAD